MDALAAEIRIAIARLTAKTVPGGAAASVEGNHHYPNKPEAATDTLKLNGVRISKDSGDAGRIAYKFTKMDFTALPTFYALVKVTGTGNHKYAENEIYTYQKVTLVPSKNVFFDDAVEAIACMAFLMNEQNENIGARRLHTIMEKLLEDISFELPDVEEKHITIDSEYVRSKFEEAVRRDDIEKFIL